MDQYNYQQPKKNNGLVIGLSIAVALLLIALVGVLAYNFGKDKGNDKEAPAAVEKTVAPADTAAQPAQTAPAQQATTAAAVPSIEKTEPAITNARSMEYLHLVGTIAGKNVVMDLSNYFGELSGSYYYSKFGPSAALQLNGSMDDSGRLYLSEYNIKNGVESGYLEGRLTNDGRLTGSFINSRGNTYRVNLRVKQ